MAKIRSSTNAKATEAKVYLVPECECISVRQMCFQIVAIGGAGRLAKGNGGPEARCVRRQGTRIVTVTSSARFVRSRAEVALYFSNPMHSGPAFPSVVHTLMPNWHDSDQSSDEISPGRRKRSSRGPNFTPYPISLCTYGFIACDQCRKTKSKCERPESGPCRTCAVASTGFFERLFTA
jgi:hypothetical protein